MEGLIWQNMIYSAKMIPSGGSTANVDLAPLDLRVAKKKKKNFMIVGLDKLMVEQVLLNTDVAINPANILLR